jgi:DNA (cytosine-5)-methyltransferase 1
VTRPRTIPLSSGVPVSRPRLLDLFSGAGGAAVGYYRAGFDVVGVDINPQPNYPFEFIKADALVLLDKFLRGSSWNSRQMADFAAVHASPPCQAYMRSGNVDRDKHPMLLAPTRALLEQTGLPWVIENVPGAPMRPDAVLCGSQFGLAIRRHRWFEVSWAEPILTLACDHSRPVTGVYGHAHGRNGAAKGMLPSDLETWSREMDINWMTTAELADAIPPAYTHLIGVELMAHIQVAA